jgi:hypothetical protein
VSTVAGLGATTQMLRSVLLDATSVLWAKLGSTPSISAVPPDRIVSEDSDQLNVFLYRASVNPALRNEGLPTRTANGSRRAQPPLALDLHYLVSAHCKVDLHAELLMGSAMLALDGMSVLTPQAISAYYGQPTPAGITSDVWTLLTGSLLDQQPEQVTVSFENMSIDDISKLWSVLGEKYRPSAAYLVTVVLLQPEGQVDVAPPVTQPAVLQVHPILTPQLAAIRPQSLTWGSATPLRLDGVNLLGAGTQVLFGADALAPPAVTSTATAIDVIVPATALAGLQPVRVRHQAVISGSGLATTSDQSNPLAVFIAPQLTLVTPSAGEVTVSLSPDVDPGQDVRLLLYGTAGRFSVAAAPRTTTQGQVTFATDGVPTGTYLMQVDVDGAATPLQQPAADQPFNGPMVTLL